ncbi:hypothetical protein F4553_005915 [Allocatelliglobosispora scoriae]|uniref:NurA domain-containing protein n=1 Tax=Allocatelliglobosispora scoriae TaxID=643052 RepID=A0A841C0S3_9ACTN|nr:hypothetical protein [Allocatelliglobosispora scoriae]MBB5872481.1 hypothetical protein [Allocatelliglobosispora scoriae]
MGFYVDAWDPGFGVSLDSEAGGPAEPSSAKVDPTVEVAPESWAPIGPPPGLSRPETVLLLDGVRRIDGSIWTDSTYAPLPGIAGSYAAGVVRCREGRLAEIASARIRRGLFTASPDQQDIDAGQGITYEISFHSGADQMALKAAMQSSLLELERNIATELHEDGALTIVDGPLRGPGGSPHSLGYVKTQKKRYLPEKLLGVVGALRSTQRTPIFKMSAPWERYTWYLRQPGNEMAPWSGIVRVECSGDLPVERAIELADLSTATLPRFASSTVKDPRAPHQLMPIAGLEKQLRRLLGDSRLLHRRLLTASTVRPLSLP